MPASQFVHTVEASDDILPAAHFPHVDCPPDAENVPAMHLLQACLPKSLMNLPASQSVQMDAVAAETFPTAHIVHSDNSFALANLPALQLVQVPEPSRAIVPISQLVQLPHPIAAYLPESHVSQFIAAFAFAIFPASHDLHAH